MTTLLYQTTGKKFTAFSPTCIEIMDFFLNYPTIYHTPTTTALSLDRSLYTIKSCMNLLKSNSYLSKISEASTVYHITKENMGFWCIDFKNHILAEHEKESHR